MSRRTIVLMVLALGIVAGGLCVARHSSAPRIPVRESHERAPTTWYTCSMHPEIVRAEPGPCPQCGMPLQPIPPDRAAAMGLAGTAAVVPAATGRTARRPAESGGAAAGTGRTVLYWKSSMIPGEIRREPGKDSMGMDLVPVYEDEVAAGGTIRIDPVIEQDMGVRIAQVTRGPLRHTVRAVGYVDYDETTLATVTTKVDGWIEKLDVDESGVQVHAGDPLFELYSRQLFSAQEEYLAALRNLQKKEVPAVPHARVDSSELLRAARTRLEYFDVPDDQIAELERSRKIRKTVTIRAPFTGIVTKKSVVEGQMVKAGMETFHLADLSTVWVMAKVFEYDLPYVAAGQEAFMELSYLPGRTFHGRVTYVYPYLDPKAREVSVRLEFHNPGYELKPGMYATLTLTRDMGEAVLVPDTAVIETGTRAVVFTRRAPGKFEAREVRLGLRSDDHRFQVLSGLAPGDSVVVSGQFLLDSESRLREAALKLREPGTVDGATPIASATAEHAGPAAPRAERERLYYVCPMPEHATILYDAPGTCPLCGMPLVPVERHGGHVGAPHIAYWTCPMPEHQAKVHASGPGKCPICGMTLIPIPEPAR